MNANVWWETVQPDDIDGFGHVSTNRMQSWVLNGLVNTFWDREAGGPAPRWFAASTHVAFAAPIGFITEPVQIRSTVSDLRRRSAEISAEVRTSAGLHATAKTVMVAIGDDGRVRAIHEAERERLQRFATHATSPGAGDQVRLGRQQATSLAVLLRDVGESLNGRDGAVATWAALESSDALYGKALRSHAEALEDVLRA